MKEITSNNISKKILVMGGDGFIGKSLIEFCISKNIKIKKIPRLSGNKLDLWANDNSADILICLAATLPHRKNFRDSDIFTRNIEVALQTLSVAKASKIKRIVFISTFLYYGNQKGIADEDSPIDERNAYKSSKSISEKILVKGSNFLDIEFVSLRPSNVYGSGQNKEMLLSKLILGARKGEIHLNDPNPIRDYLHVKDLCSAILDVSHISMQENYLIFNVASGETFTNLELAELIQDKINPDSKIYVKNVQRENESNDGRMNSKKLRNYTNWKPKISMSEFIANKALN